MKNNNDQEFLRRIKEKEEEINRLAKKYQIKEWKMFDHCFAWICSSKMLIFPNDRMNLTHLRKFQNKIESLFDDFCVDIECSESLQGYVDYGMITQEFHDKIMQNAKPIHLFDIRE